MTQPPRLEALLEDILTHCAYILEDTLDTTFEEFVANRPMRQTVERNFIVIGICASRIRDHFPETYDDIEMLRDAINLRNRLAHGYDQEIDQRILWITVTTSIPRLVDHIANRINRDNR